MLIKYEFTLGAALAEFTKSEKFREQLKAGRYIYAENHLCINHPSYIQWIDGVAKLTDYAKCHKDMCCLGVDILTIKNDSSLDSLADPTWGYQGERQRRDDSSSECTSYNRSATIHLDVSGTQHVSIGGSTEYRFPEHVWLCKPSSEEHPPIQRLTTCSRRVMALSESLPSHFSQMLDSLIKAGGVKEEDLAAESNLSEKTIQRLRQHDPKSVTLETVVQLCIGLHLNPTLSLRLLRAAGKTFMDTKLHDMYQFLIFTCYEYTVDVCNILLESLGLPVLGKSKK